MLKLHQIKNSKKESQGFTRRIILASVVMGVFCLILFARLVYLQVYQNRFYASLAKHNQFEQVPIEPKRGLIYDRNGILLAENLPAFSVDIIPDFTPNIKNTIATLSKIIDLDQKTIRQFYRSLSRHKKYEPIPIKFKLTQTEVASIYVNRYRLPGIEINANLIRHYPLGPTTVSALGYVGRINLQDLKTIDQTNYAASNFIGKIGIEKHYEKELHGKVGYKVAEIDASGHIVKTLNNIAPVSGDNLYLTIDSKMQQIAIDSLGEENGAVVAIDPNNGQVLTLVSSQPFDPNLFSNGIDVDTFDDLQNSDDKPMNNRAVHSSYPPGSTIKPFLALKALDSNTIDKNYTIFDPGWFRLPNTKQAPFRDWVHNGHGRVNVVKAIIESCDTFFYTIGVKLGIAKIGDALERFGFNKKTGIDIDEETSGVVPSQQWKMKHIGKHWYIGDTVNSAIGQGYMLATPLQLANAVAAISKKGERFTPHLLLKTVKSSGLAIEQPAKPLPPVKLNNKNNWDLVIDAMRRVISDQKGTARMRFGTNVEYEAAGKTGTTQLYHHKIVNENPTPESDKNIPKRLRNHSLFIAFAPVDAPKIAVAVIVENNITAPAIARKIMDYYLTQESVK
ncbi:MAG: penicillin-binding protein 2 [Gammaproteobacteria bacterium]|nr:penicillin-binding protein 2 [Gammaproteobacteria bacterium]